MSGNWIKLHRKLMENPIFRQPELLQLFIYCILRANHKDTEIIHGMTTIKVERGEFVAGRFELAEFLNQNPNTVYKRLKKLENLNFLNTKSNNKFTFIKVVNYEVYQSTENENIPPEATTYEQQSNNKVTTKEQQNNTDKNDKNEKNDKNVSKKEKNNKKEKVEKAYLIFGELENVKLTYEEHQKLKAQLNGRLDHYINKLSTWLESSGNEKKSHYATILNWSLEERRASQSSQAPSQNPSWQVLKDWEKSRSEA